MIDFTVLTHHTQGLCNKGEGGSLVDSGNNTYGGRYVVNPSGGLISKGHPLGATGLAQCTELTWQVSRCMQRLVYSLLSPSFFETFVSREYAI